MDETHYVHNFNRIFLHGIAEAGTFCTSTLGLKQSENKFLCYHLKLKLWRLIQLYVPRDDYRALSFLQTDLLGPYLEYICESAANNEHSRPRCMLVVLPLHPSSNHDGFLHSVVLLLRELGVDNDLYSFDWGSI